MRVPTLVQHRREVPWLPVDLARALAAQIPDARLAVLEGESTAPYLGNTEAVASSIDAFLQEGDAEAPARPGMAASSPGPARPAASRDGLTAREVEVLRLITGGRTNHEIAEELSVSVRTVERHAANIYAKLGARGRADATAYALTHHLL